jgi:hypothetical protein
MATQQRALRALRNGRRPALELRAPDGGPASPRCRTTTPIGPACMPRPCDPVCEACSARGLSLTGPRKQGRAGCKPNDGTRAGRAVVACRIRARHRGHLAAGRELDGGLPQCRRSTRMAHGPGRARSVIGDCVPDRHRLRACGLELARVGADDVALGVVNVTGGRVRGVPVGAINDAADTQSSRAAPRRRPGVGALERRRAYHAG